MRRALIAVTVGALVVAHAPREARAEEARAVTHAVLGSEAAGYDGWTEIVTEVRALGAAFDGEVTLEVERYSSTPDSHVLARTPVHVPAGATRRVMLPVQLRHRGGGDLRVLVRNAQGQVVQRESPILNGTHGPLFTALDDSLSLGQLKSTPIHTSPSSRAYDGGERMMTSHVQVDRTTGRPVLPTRASSYHHVTAAGISAKSLTALEPAERDALFTWIRAGGSLVVVRAPAEAVAPYVGADGPRMVSVRVGAGEVHVLSSESPLHDDWLDGRIVSIVASRWGIRSTPMPLGGGSAMMSQYDAVRRLLDPNEGFRPALGFAALALVGYAALVGPLAYAFARRRRRPFLPLLTTPALSIGAFATVVGVGLATKGVHGRAMHFAFVEVDSGNTAGTVRHFRTFYTGNAKNLTVKPLAQASVLDAARDDLAVGTLEIREGGAVLENVKTMPWQPVMVREDGIVDLGRGIRLERDGAGVRLTNGTAREMVDVVLFAPGETHFFASVPAGGQVTTVGHAGLGRDLSFQNGSYAEGGTRSHRSVQWYDLRTAIAGAPHLGDDWAPLEGTSSGPVDWGSPFVLAKLAGGAKDDSGLPVTKSTTLVHVHGFAEVGK